MNRFYQILLIEDHHIVRSGLRMSLELNANYKICGEAGSIQEALDLSAKIKPDLVLLDLKLPDSEGVSGYLRIKRCFLNADIMVLTAYVDRYTLKELIREGLKGLFMKKIDSDGLFHGIENLRTGLYAFDESLLNDIIQMLQDSVNTTSELNDKELFILAEISQGKMNKEIACILNVSEKTVRNNISAIYKKIGVTNRTEAASLWIKRSEKH